MIAPLGGFRSARGQLDRVIRQRRRGQSYSCLDPGPTFFLMGGLLLLIFRGNA